MFLNNNVTKRGLTVVLILIVITINLFASSLSEAYKKRLEESSAYKNLELQLLSSQQALGTYSDIFDPYLTLNLQQPGGFTFAKTVKDFGDTQTKQTNLNMSADLKLFHVFGTSIGLTFPFQYTIDSEGETDFVFNSLGLNISRKLISEENAEKLGVQAQYLHTLHSLEQQEWMLFFNLVNDVFNQKFYSGLEAVNRKRMEIFSAQFNDAKDEELKDSYKQQKLLSQKALLTTEKMLDQITLFSPKELNMLYDQIENLIKEMYANYNESHYIQPSKKLRALELEMEKALAEKELWFLPYLFNPTISFNLEYYFDDADTTGIQPSDFDWLDPDLLPDDFNWPSFGNQAGDFKWSIGVTGSLDIFDRGERKTAALKRENTYEIKYLELEEEKERIEKQLKLIALDIDISKVDLELNELTFEKKIEDAEQALELYKQGFIKLEEKQLTLLEMEQSRLDFIKALHQLYLNRLTLMKDSGTSLGGYLQ